MPKVTVEKGVLNVPGRPEASVNLNLAPGGTIVETIAHDGVRTTTVYTPAEAAAKGAMLLKLSGIGEALQEQEADLRKGSQLVR